MLNLVFKASPKWCRLQIPLQITRVCHVLGRATLESFFDPELSELSQCLVWKRSQLVLALGEASCFDQKACNRKVPTIHGPTLEGTSVRQSQSSAFFHSSLSSCGVLWSRHQASRCTAKWKRQQQQQQQPGKNKLEGNLWQQHVEFI